MKRTALGIILLMMSSIVLLSGCQQPTQNANTTAASPTPETVDTAAIEAELLRIENDWPRVIKERDVEAVKRLEADEGVFVYPDGTIGDKNTDIKDMETGALSADSWEMLDLKVIVLSKDAAVVNGRSVVKNGKYKLPDGKSIDISGQYRFIDTFVRRNGQWKLIAGAATPIRQPVATASPSASPAASSSTSPAAGASPAAGSSPAAAASPGARRPLPPTKAPPSPEVKRTP
jgi:hypothetical protein